MTDFNGRVPKASPFNDYGTDCPCGGWLHKVATGDEHRADAVIYECDGNWKLDEKHQWRWSSDCWALVKSVEMVRT